jgi:outer membrane protein OmpA-like peptidoglycan-associated protein
VVALLCAWCAFASAARAQGFDTQTLALPAGKLAGVAIPDPDTGAPGTVVLGTSASYARWPLVRSARCDLGQSIPDVSCLRDDGVTPIVSDRIDLELSVAATLWRGLALGMVVPLSFARVADSVLRPERLEDELGPGDLRLSADLPLLTGNSALALGLTTSLPFGEEQRFTGDDGATLSPRVVVRQRLGEVALAAQLGYRARPRAELLGLVVDDELEAMLGVSAPLLRSLALRAELRARFGLFAPDSRGSDPLEATVAAAIEPSTGLLLLVGGGAGLWPGRDGYGAPLFRALAALRYAWKASGKDADADGVDDANDGCPELREDEDGFFDHDGCPDRDDDADGLRDELDQCPRSSEDRDGVQDEDGCPDRDDDGDQVADGLDGCPMDPEDSDGFEDRDGCPEPGPGAPTVTVGPERMLVSEPILFDYDHDALRATSGPVLDALAAAIRELPADVRVLVEVYVDASGNGVYDLDLTSRRAEAVAAALRERGVEPQRVDHVGRGASGPFVPTRTPQDRARDRRVELLLRR